MNEWGFISQESLAILVKSAAICKFIPISIGMLWLCADGKLSILKAPLSIANQTKISFVISSKPKQLNQVLQL